MTFPVGGLTGQIPEQMPELPASGGEGPAVGGDAHARLGDTDGDELGIGDPAPRIGPPFWQQVIGCAIDDRAESVEVSVRRGLRADGVLGTVGFGLSLFAFPA